MKNLWQTFILLALLLALLQAPDLNEAKKIKKLVKELKKLKKYAYLLAATKKKLYAIPFPMPLPVFVKRQHIYTQVPIIPRYVQHPQHYGSPAIQTESASSYEMMSDSSPVSVYPRGYSASSHKKPSLFGSSASASASNDFSSQYLGNSGKYLSSIASLLGQATPMSSSASKDLLGKFLNGQARLLPPTALLASIKGKGPVGSMKMLKQHEQEQQQNQDDQHEQQDQDSKSHSSSAQSGSSSSSSGGVTYDDTTTPSKSTSKPPESASDSKPAASEVYKSAMAFRAMRPLVAAAPFMNPFQFPAMMAPMMSPMAALVAANRAQALAPRLPTMRAPFAANIMDQYEGANQLGEAQDPQEMSASSSQDHETVSRDYPSNLAALLRHRQIHEQQLQNHQPSEQATMFAVQKLHREQLLARQQRAAKLALLRDQELAARLAESRQILVRAHQMGVPMAPSVQQNLLANYARQLVV